MRRSECETKMFATEYQVEGKIVKSIESRYREGEEKTGDREDEVLERQGSVEKTLKSVEKW